jgi:polyisoprenoid-binding protein YceI
MSKALIRAVLAIAVLGFAAATGFAQQTAAGSHGATSAQTPASAPQTPPDPNTWTIDPNHTSAQFAVRHMMVSTVRGKLGKVSGTVKYDGNDPNTLQVDAAIDLQGIDTGVENRDNDLRSANFFDVAQYPTINFKSKRVIPGAASGSVKLVGDLTMHGKTREVTLDVEPPSPPVKMGNRLRSGTSASAKINRRDFGLLYNKLLETGGAVVGDEVSITIDVEATKAATTATQ